MLYTNQGSGGGIEFESSPAGADVRSPIIQVVVFLSLATTHSLDIRLIFSLSFSVHVSHIFPFILPPSYSSILSKPLSL